MAQECQRRLRHAGARRAAGQLYPGGFEHHLGGRRGAGYQAADRGPAQGFLRLPEPRHRSDRHHPGSAGDGRVPDGRASAAQARTPGVGAQRGGGGRRRRADDRRRGDLGAGLASEHQIRRRSRGLHPAGQGQAAATARRLREPCASVARRARADLREGRLGSAVRYQRQRAGRRPASEAGRRRLRRARRGQDRPQPVVVPGGRRQGVRQGHGERGHQGGQFHLAVDQREVAAPGGNRARRDPDGDVEDQGLEQLGRGRPDVAAQSNSTARS